MQTRTLMKRLATATLAAGALGLGLGASAAERHIGGDPLFLKEMDNIDNKQRMLDREQRDLDRRQSALDRERAQVLRIYSEAGARFEFIDANDNGVIESTEADIAPALGRMFEDLDTDGSGTLTLSEYQEHRMGLFRKSP